MYYVTYSKLEKVKIKYKSRKKGIVSKKANLINLIA